MPISYGDGGDISPEKKKEPTVKAGDRLEQVIERANEDMITGTAVVEESDERDPLDVQPVDPQVDPSTAFSRLPVVEVPDRLGQLVDLKPRDIRELTFEDEEGDDFTPG